MVQIIYTLNVTLYPIKLKIFANILQNDCQALIVGTAKARPFFGLA